MHNDVRTHKASIATMSNGPSTKAYLARPVCLEKIAPRMREMEKMRAHVEMTFLIASIVGFFSIILFALLASNRAYRIVSKEKVRAYG